MTTLLASDAELLKQIDGFLSRTGMPITTFGRRVVNDPNLIANLREGRELRRATEARVRSFMDEYQPAPDTAKAA